MSQEIQLSWSALDTLLPLCREIKEKLEKNEKVDLHDVAARAGAAFGIDDIDEFVQSKFEQAMNDGLRSVFDEADAKELAGLFAGLCKPVMSNIYKYAQGEIKPGQLFGGLNKLYVENADALQSVLGQTLGIPEGATEFLSTKLGSSLVSVYCFTAAYKIYQQAAQDAELARQHRIEIEQCCNEAIAGLKAERAELETFLGKYLLDRLEPFAQATASMDQAILDNDDDGFIAANAELWELFGRKTQYRTASEFDDLMLSDETFKL